MPDAPAAAPAKGGSFLTRKVGPLPTYAYLVAAVGVIGFVWWRNRSASQAAASGVTPDASTAGDSSAVPTTDYGQGFDYGYAAGANATGSGQAAQDSSGSGDSDGDSDGTRSPLSHHRYCFHETDPSGKSRLVCSFGHWVKRNGEWHWQVGAPPAGKAGGGGPGSTGHRPRRIDVRRTRLEPLRKGQAVPFATV